MKPNFALTLSFEGIGLLHRTLAGWHLVGEVGLDAEDLAGDLAELAAKARALDPTGLRTKLVLPNEQVKYLSFETAERDIGRIEAAVKGALDGATPYTLKELSYDWSVRRGTVHVAAVARETLAEAESFADEHAFNPLCFVSMPDDADFAGEPFFGETVYAGKVLGPDESVDRENTVIRIVGAAHLPDPEPVPAEAAPDPVAESGPTPEPAPEPKPPAPKGKGADAPVAFSTTRAAGGAAPPLTGATRSMDLPKARFTPPPIAPERPLPKAPPPEAAPPERPAPAPAAPDPADMPDDGTPPLPEALRADSDASLAAPAEQAPARAGLGAFFSRRTPRAGRGTPGKKAGTRPKREAPVPAPPSEEPPEEPTVIAGPALPTTVGDDMLDEAQRMTIFGARRTEAMEPDRPRYLALALTALLLLVLVGIAAWAALFLDTRISGLFRDPAEAPVTEASEPTADTAAAADPPAADPPETDPPAAATPDEEEAADMIAAVLPEDGAATGPETQTPDAQPDPPTPLAEIVPEELTPDEARARYAATGIWQMAPAPSTVPGTTALEDVYQTNLDPEVGFSDAVALPEAGALVPQGRPPTPSDPPPPGTRFQLDNRGFIAATPDGVETPEGITIFAGRPPVLPPRIPPRAAPQVLDGPAAAAPEEPTLRPRPRPGDLTERHERTQLGGRTRTELATVRPRLRPKSAQQLAEEALAARTGAEDDSDDPLAGATDQAVAASLRPHLRPARFAGIVEKAREAAAAEPVSVEQRVAVNIPTTASVARAATEKKRISLREVNLIGVYGTPSSRRALVRLANGRYRKVQVGDRLDGGQVAAIGDDELRYIKRGRSVVLKMPKG